MLTDIIEAIIFAAGNGIHSQEIYVGLEKKYSKKEIERAIADLKQTYSGDRGIHLIEYNAKFQFQNNPEYGAVLSDILLETRERELSKTLLKVLAIIAYEQPVTRHEIQDIRGVSPDYVVAMLLKLDLIEPKGRRETLGNPIEYGTTDEFLRKFGLTSLLDLPDYEDMLMRIQNNHEKYHAMTTGLYRERNISTDPEDITGDDTEADEKYAEIAAALEAIDAGDEEEGEDDDYPDFLEGEDIVEID